MKNLFKSIIISAFLFTSASLYAEEEPQKDAGSFYRNRISFAYGFASAHQFAIGFGIGFGGIFKSLFSDLEAQTYSSFGPISLAYDRNVSKHLSIGVVLAYEYYASEQTWTDGETERKNYDIFTLMPKMKFRWGWEIVSFYHGISLGAGLWLTETEYSSGETDSQNYATLAIHFYLFGINLDIGDIVSIFGDFGLGSLGTINTGLAFNF
jgi:hypothetical protein